MLYKMYYKSNIELIHLFVTKTKCHIFLQIDIFNKKISISFLGISRPCPDRDEISSGRDGTRDRNPVPSLFRDRTGVSDPVPSHEHPYLCNCNKNICA